MTDIQSEGGQESCRAKCTDVHNQIEISIFVRLDSPELGSIYNRMSGVTRKRAKSMHSFKPSVVGCHAKFKKIRRKGFGYGIQGF